MGCHSVFQSHLPAVAQGCVTKKISHINPYSVASMVAGADIPLHGSKTGYFVIAGLEVICISKKCLRQYLPHCSGYAGLVFSLTHNLSLVVQ